VEKINKKDYKFLQEGVRYLIFEKDWMSEVNVYSGVYDSTDRFGGLQFRKIHYYSPTPINTGSVQNPTTRFSTAGLTLFIINPKLNDNIQRCMSELNDGRYYGGQYKKSRKKQT